MKVMSKWQRSAPARKFPVVNIVTSLLLHFLNVTFVKPKKLKFNETTLPDQQDRDRSLKAATHQKTFEKD